MISQETIADYLRRLGSGQPTPGGGATGALQLAHAAALLSMSARFSKRRDIAKKCATLGWNALKEADADESGFAEVARAFDLPQNTDEEQDQRTQKIQKATRRATDPLRNMIDTSERLMEMASAILNEANPNIYSDIGVALGCIRSGLIASIITLETNLKQLHDANQRTQLSDEVFRAEHNVRETDQLISRTRRLINP